ncbi:MAG: hypothetical protein U1F42_06565 [Candidatus Competibacteraceae bacterium]
MPAAAAADDAATQAVIEDIACVGAEDPAAVRRAFRRKIRQFFTEAERIRLVAWRRNATPPTSFRSARVPKAAAGHGKAVEIKWTIISPAAAWPRSIFAPPALNPA